MKDQKCSIETLAAKVAEYERGGKHMVNCLYEIGRKLTAVLPERFIYSWGHVGYTSSLKDSNVGFYGEALCFIADIGEDTSNCEYWYPVEPDGWEDAGASYYLHGDFCKTINQPTRDMLKIMAKELPNFIAELANYIENSTKQNEEATEVLAKMLEACIPKL